MRLEMEALSVLDIKCTHNQSESRLREREIPLTLGGTLAGRAAAHLLPALVRTRLAAHVGLDEFGFVHLPHDADLQSIPATKTHRADGAVSASRGSCEHDAWVSALFGRGGGGSRAGRGGWHARTRWFSLFSMPHPKQQRRT